MFNHRDKVTKYELDDELQILVANLEKGGSTAYISGLFMDKWEGSGPYTQKVIVPGITSNTNGAMGWLTTHMDYRTLEIANSCCLTMSEQGEGYVVIRALKKPTCIIPIWIIHGAAVLPPMYGSVTDEGSERFTLTIDKWDRIGPTDFRQRVEIPHLVKRMNGCVGLVMGKMNATDVGKAALYRLDIEEYGDGYVVIKSISKPDIELPCYIIYGASILPPTTVDIEEGRPINAEFLNGLPGEAYILKTEALQYINEAILNSDLIKQAVAEAIKNNEALKEAINDIVSEGLLPSGDFHGQIIGIIGDSINNGAIGDAINGAKPITLTATLAVNAWNDNDPTNIIQEVTLPYVTEEHTVLVALDSDSTLDEEQHFAECAIKCTGQASHTLIFTARAKRPTMTITMSVMLFSPAKVI